MLNFQWPFLFLLLPLPWIIRSFFPVVRETSAAVPTVRFPHLTALQKAFQGSRQSGSKPNMIFPILLFSAWTLLVVALTRPQIVNQVTNVKNNGHDLMLAVDLSGSMQSLDFSDSEGRISRLDVAKNVVKDFLKKRSGDRVGLILFGEHAYLNAPLTLDTAAVGQMLDNSLPGMAGDATAIGDALGLAVKNLRDRPARSRAIILLTDGEDNASTLPPLQAAKIAQQYGIHIYTVVIGKEGMVPFPDGHGGTVMVESSVDTALTKKIAQMTGGEFYTATDRQALTKIYDRIDQLEKSTVQTQHFLIRTPLFQYPMTLALIFIAILISATLVKGKSYELTAV